MQLNISVLHGVSAYLAFMTTTQSKWRTIDTVVIWASSDYPQLLSKIYNWLNVYQKSVFILCHLSAKFRLLLILQAFKSLTLWCWFLWMTLHQYLQYHQFWQYWYNVFIQGLDKQVLLYPFVYHHWLKVVSEL